MFLILCLLYGSLASAKVYKWMDENGVMHYSESKPEIKTATEIKVKGINDQDKKSDLTNNPSLVLDCEQGVKHGLKLVKAAFIKEGLSADNPTIGFLDDPNQVSESVDECEKDRKDPKKKAIWLCQKTVQSYTEITVCDE